MQFFYVFVVVLAGSSVFCSASRGYFNAVQPRGGEVESVPIAKTITVDRSGKGDFTTIQSAINSIPVRNSQWIRVRVRSGIYQEKVTVPPSKAFILLEGDSRDSTIITWDDADNLMESATVSIWADNFIAKRITFVNTYNIGSAVNPPKQAPAVFIYADKCSFYECGFVGLQDTLFDCLGRHYFYSCYIEGAIDFIFGSGQSIYDKCLINVTANEYRIRFGFITAQGRQHPDEQNGFVFKYCSVIGTMNAYLGRAWRPYSRVIYYASEFSEIVVPEGWDAWSFKGNESTITFAEHGCTGSGSNTDERVKWAKKLTHPELSLLVGLAFIDNEGWLQQQPNVL